MPKLFLGVNEMNVRFQGNQILVGFCNVRIDHHDQFDLCVLNLECHLWFDHEI